MGRNATIRIDNQTGCLLKYKTCDVIHGKFNADPPASIHIGSTGEFKVGNHDGALIGPKGTVTYTTTVAREDIMVEVDLIFSWNHPWSAATSSYTAGSIPANLLYSELNPAIPSGHDQTVTLTIEFKNLQDVYNIRDWMRFLNEKLSIAEITIPGTHETGALNGGVAYECQTMNITTQLDKGIRYFDIRCRKLDSGALEICHGSGITRHDMGFTFEQVQTACLNFLKQHPHEFIIMSVKQEDGPDLEAAFRNAINSVIDKWYLEQAIPAIENVRGKIILLRRFDSREPLGINGLPWANNASFTTDNGNISVQDNYEVFDTLASIDNKWNNIEGALNHAKESNDKILYINYTSGATHMAPVMLATGASIVVGASGINEKLYNYISDKNNSRFGIIAMDFPESPNEFLIPYIIATNNFSYPK